MTADSTTSQKMIQNLQKWRRNVSSGAAIGVLEASPGHSVKQALQDDVGFAVVLMGGENIGDGEDGHARGFAGTDAGFAVFHHGATAGVYAKLLCGEEEDVGGEEE